MADYKATNKTNRDAEPSVNANPGEEYVRKFISYDSFTITAALLNSSSDTITFMKIPKGARVLDLQLVCGDLGGTGTMNIGWAASSDGVEVADPDGFGAAVDLSGQANHYKLSDQVGLAGTFKKFSAEVEVQLAVAADFTATSGDIEVLVEYAVY